MVIRPFTLFKDMDHVENLKLNILGFCFFGCFLLFFFPSVNQRYIKATSSGRNDEQQQNCFSIFFNPFFFFLHSEICQ